MKSLQAWKDSVLGKKIDFDNASYDCVDVSKSWIMYLSDKPWQQSAGWGNAKDIYFNWYGTFLDRIARGNAPKLGDILVMNEQVGGGFGHTGVVIAIDGRNIQIAQQNTFTQQAVYTGWYDAYAGNVTGFLRPKIAFEIGATPTLQPWQRIVGDGGVYYRKEPKKAGESIELFKANDVVDFKGFVRGEAVDGNNIWFVGRHTGFYSWSGGYKDSGTHDLPDLTPATTPPLADNQRRVGNDAMNVRTSAKVDTVNNNVVRLIQPATVITVNGYVRGQNVDGNDKWFVLEDGTYTWVGGYTNQDVSKLNDLTPVTPAPTDPTTPQPAQYPVPTTDSRITAVVNKKHPNNPLDYAPTDLVTLGNGQMLRKEAADAMALMQSAATAAGAGLVMGSGYRTYATQKSLYDGYVAKDGQDQADRYSARAGYSEHQTGLVMDFSPIDDVFKNSVQYSWLMANAHKYGFVLRYAADKEYITGYMSEPWHWRYVGVTVATDMKTKGVTTLEEYYNIPGGKYADQEPKPTDPVPTEPPQPPAPTDEAAKSATQFVARVTSQLAAAAIVVNGLAGLVKSYVGVTFDGSILGGAILLLALGLVAYSQYRYKKSGGAKGWLF